MRSTGWLATLAILVLMACSDSPADPGADAGTTDGAILPDGAASPDSGPGPDASTGPDAWTGTSCNFGYDTEFVYPAYAPLPGIHGPGSPANWSDGPDQIAHLEPPPPSTHRMSSRYHAGRKDPPDLVMPTYNDNMPVFDRALAWSEPTRCYELPDVAVRLTEEEAWELYRDIAELTTGVSMDTSPEVRTVVGIRGAYPGTFNWHGNLPDRFNDTLVLLWRDTADVPHVREFAVNTDTGAYDFGYHSSSSLRPNRRYHHHNDWHNSYNALHINEVDYLVWDDANKNGHWDSDRNGWLAPATPEDHERTGSGHNIHMGSVDAPLGSAVVGIRSAGCQVIPGYVSWEEFIYNAWTTLGDPVNYFLVDARDIDHRVWAPCTPDGTHDCPFEIDTFPFTDQRDTTTGVRRDDVYNCSTVDESGPEIVYFFTLDDYGTLSVSVVADGPDTEVDPDIHLLDGDDANACLNRAHTDFTHDLGPGRYFVVVDTFVDGGVELAGGYTLNVDFQ